MSIILNVGDQAVTLTAKTAAVTLTANTAAVTLSTYIPGPQGDVGPPGPTGGAGYTLPTNSDIGGNRAITSSNSYAAYADNTDETTYCVGLSMGAISSGADVTLQSGGKMTVSGAGWTESLPVFVSTNGTLTQSAPVTGYVQQVGMAFDSETLIIEINEPTYLEV